MSEAFAPRSPCVQCGQFTSITSVPEPEPVDNGGPDVFDLVREDFDMRARLGLESYGVVLRPGNGRNGLRDLYEELLDACVYVRQVLAEIELGIWKA